MSAPIKRWGNVYTHRDREELLANVMEAIDELLSLPARCDIMDDRRIAIGEVVRLNDPADDGSPTHNNGLVVGAEGIYRRRDQYRWLRPKRVEDTVLTRAEIISAVEDLQIGVNDVERAIAILMR